MKEIIIKIDNNGNLQPIDNYSRQLVLASLKFNKQYEIKIVNKRNIKHLAKYWILLKALSFHFGNTDNGWHLYLKSKFLPLEEFQFKSGKKILYPSSVAFDKMNQIEFDEYYKKVEDFLIENGYNIDELIEHCEI